jgi:antibiotic biosynthesis monooxygenase
MAGVDPRSALILVEQPRGPEQVQADGIRVKTQAGIVWMALAMPGSSRPRRRAIFAVIFEVQPKKEAWDRYLELAKFLKPELEQIDGFIDNERFASQRTDGRVLSLSTWRGFEVIEKNEYQR